jgi:hypothetical protein
MSFDFRDSRRILRPSREGDGGSLADPSLCLDDSDLTRLHASQSEVAEINTVPQGLYFPPIGDKRKISRERECKEVEEIWLRNEEAITPKSSGRNLFKKNKVERRQISWVHKHFTLSVMAKSVYATAVSSTCRWVRGTRLLQSI